MAAYETLRAAIDSYIKANGNKEITGTVLNDILNAMVSALGADTRFAGVAVPSTNPGNPEGNVVYFASQAGTYSNFGGIVLPLGIHILVWNGTAWTSQTWFSVNNTPTQNSQNLVTSGGIFQAIVDAVGVERLRAIGAEVTSCSFNSTTKKISFFNSANTTLFQLDATAFIIDGMVSDVKIEDGNLVIQFNTDAGKHDIEIPLTEIFDPANYYTKTAIDTLLTAINNKLADGCLYRGMAEPTTNPPTPTTKVFYIATKAGTYTNFDNIAVTEGITILKYDGSNWSKEQISYCDGVFDISAYNGTSYADLSSALGTNGANIPQNLRKGGMSVKFVQSSDNKYVQYRLMSDTFNTTPANWQGVDDEPTVGSENLVKSGGVYSNNSWNLDEQEEFNIIDKKGRTGFSVGKDGVKARAYNVVDENGDIVNIIGRYNESVFDISAYNLTDGQLTKYADLATALGTNGTNVPELYRRGGMTIKYIQSSSNKYVQYRLMTTSFSTTVSDWQGVDNEPIAGSDNLVTSGGLHSNSSWDLEETEEFNIADKNGKKGLSVGKDGVKARAYNIVDENGAIISTIGDYDKLGDGGFFQEKKGTYYFPSSITFSGTNLSCVVVGNEAKFEKSIKVEVSGITPTSDTSFPNRGSLIVNFNNPIKVKETLSLWYFVPTKFWKQDYRGGENNVCLDNFHLYFYNGDTQIYHQYISLYEYHCGWNLFKFLTDDLVNTTITKVEVRFYSYNNHPNFVCYLGHFVADQRMTPILNFNMDGILDGITYTSGFAQWLMNNNIPVDLRLYGFGSYEEGEAEWKTITRKMYFSGLINGMTYSGEAKNFALQQAVTYLKTGDVLHGREAALYDIPAVRDIILCGAAGNFVDDELLLAAKLAGYKMIRDSNAYKYTSYIDSQCCVMPTYGVCGITDVTLSGEALDADIAAKVSDAKSKIDKLIKYGMAMSMFTHQVASKTQQGESGFNTLASYAEGVEEIFSYALQKQSEGKLLIKSMYNIINNK